MSNRTPHGARTVSHLRWWLAGLLFASTVINYIDRQSLAVLGPFLKHDLAWSNQDFAYVVMSFRAAYAIGQAVSGYFVDRLGTRKALSLSVAWYSLAALASTFATGLRSLCSFRFLLGIGESGNWPAATKAVSEWFPKQERAWAVAIFDSGSAIGAAVAPFLVLSLYHVFGSWRAALAIPGLLGFIWLLVWRRWYRTPEEHPSLSEAERTYIQSGRDVPEPTGKRASWIHLLGMRQTWGILFGRMLTDPVWFFIADWFAVYLQQRKFEVEQGILAFWIPFLAADAGNFLGGGVSSWLIRRGWNTIPARKAVIIVCGFGMALLALTVFASSLPALIALFSVATCSYAAWSTMALTLPADLYPANSVASVSGLSGAGSGIGTIISTFLIGWTADRYSFAPVLVVGSLIPLLATASVLLLVPSSLTRERA